MTYRSGALVSDLPAPFSGPDRVDGESWVYYHLDADGGVLYIGKTKHPEQRTKQHEGASGWFSDVARIIWFGPLSEMAALSVERELIGVEQPANNVIWTDRDPRWLRFSPEARVTRAQLRVDRARLVLDQAEQLLRTAEAAAEPTA